MRKNLIVGILRETKKDEWRTPLVPSDVNWLIKRGISVEVESSPQRVFSDNEFRKRGVRVLDKIQKASLLLGIKEPSLPSLYSDKIYMIFSHTAKGQSSNMDIIKSCLKKKITLIDYEKIADVHGRRLVFFGRFAGICGLVDSLHYLGKKLEWQGIKNPFSSIEPAHKYSSLESLKKAMSALGQHILRYGFDKQITPFVIGITGHGNVSNGAQEILKTLSPIEVHPKDMLKFVRHQKGMRHNVYQIVFLREEKFRSKEKKGFYFEEYLKSPEKFESNLDTYLPHLNIFIHSSYWDRDYPRMVTKKMVHKLYKKKPFRLKFIGDLSCDINGSIELTHKSTSSSSPTFTYSPKSKRFVDGYKAEGITVLAVDNLPSELPKDASVEFSSLIREYVYQIAAHGIKDVTRHVAIPVEIRRAVIAERGELTRPFSYIKEFIAD